MKDPKLNACPWTVEDTIIFLRLQSGAYDKRPLIAPGTYHEQRWQKRPYRALYYRTLNI